jgi:MFS family permease
VKLKTYPRTYFELLIAAFTLIMGMSLSAAFLPLFAYELDSSEVLIGFVSSAWFITRIFTELPSGILADHFGKRKLIIGGIALSAFGAFLCSIANSIYFLIVGRAVWGLGTGLFFMSSSATIFDLFKLGDRGRALGTFQAIQFFGSLIGAPLGSFMVRYSGYKGVFLLACILMISSSVIALISKGLVQTETRKIRSTTTSSLTDLFINLKNWKLTPLCISSFSRMLVMMGISGTVFSLYLNFEIGINVELIGLIISIRTVGLILATISSGYLSDKYGRKIVIVFGISLQGICFFTYTLVSTFDMIIFIGLFEGFSRGLILTSLMILLSEVVSPKIRGGAIGMYRTFMDVGGFIGPLFFMIIYNKLGSQNTFITGTIILAMNIPLILTVNTKKRKGS